MRIKDDLDLGALGMECVLVKYCCVIKHSKLSMKYFYSVGQEFRQGIAEVACVCFKYLRSHE